MPSNLGSELDKAYQELRGIESEIAVLSGRNQQNRAVRRRVVVDCTESAFDNSHVNNERRVFQTGNHRRIVITAPNTSAVNGYSRKRTRNEDDVDDEEEDNRVGKNSAFYLPQKRTLQSSVVMPTIETKSRAEIITEIKKSEKKEDAVRNRRLFSNLIVGTLKQFQKEEKNVKDKFQVQTEKQREIERRLELTEQESRDRINKEKEELLERRHEKEQEILRLKRERAIVKYAEEKEQHFRRLQCFIQTQTKPPIFFLPGKHTLRTLELLKDSAKKVEGLISLRRDEMERELHRDRVSYGEEKASDDEELSVGIRSAVVAVVKEESKPTGIALKPTNAENDLKMVKAVKQAFSQPSCESKCAISVNGSKFELKEASKARTIKTNKNTSLVAPESDHSKSASNSGSESDAETKSDSEADSSSDDDDDKESINSENNQSGGDSNNKLEVNDESNSAKADEEVDE